MTSWVIYTKDNKPWFETWSKKNVDTAKMNALKVVPIMEYLSDINKKARGES